MLTEEKVKELIEAALKESTTKTEGLVAEAANKAVTAQFKRQSFRDMIGEAVGNAVTTATEALKKGLENADDDDDDNAGADDKGKGGSKLPDEVAKTLKKLQRDNERLLAKVEETEKKRQEAADKARSTGERSALAEQLSKIGVDKELLEVALGHLKGRVKTIEDDKGGSKVVWLDDDELEVALADGVKSWAESDLGKRFKMPREVSGSGNSGGPIDLTPDKDGNVTDAQLGVLLAGQPLG
jgi:hypothetical protein